MNVQLKNKSKSSEIVHNILSYYENKEKNLINEQVRYFAYRTCDSDLTEFEKKSLNNQIILKTKLNDSDAYILLRILSCICQENYYLFNNPTFIQEIYDDNHLNINLNDIRNMVTNSELHIIKWIEYLNLLAAQDDIEDYLEINALKKYQNNFNIYGTHVNDLQVYKIVPPLLDSRLKRQYINTIESIKESNLQIN